MLESLQKVLKPLANFTVILSALRPVLYILKNDVLAKSEGDSELTADIKRRILVYMKSKYRDSERSELLDVASFLTLSL